MALVHAYLRSRRFFSPPVNHLLACDPYEFIQVNEADTYKWYFKLAKSEFRRASVLDSFENSG